MWQRLAAAGVPKGRTVAINARSLEANAAMRAPGARIDSYAPVRSADNLARAQYQPSSMALTPFAIRHWRAEFAEARSQT